MQIPKKNISVFLPLCFCTTSKRKCRIHLKMLPAAKNYFHVLYWLLVFICQSTKRTTHTCMHTFAKSSVHDVHFKYCMLTHEHVLARCTSGDKGLNTFLCQTSQHISYAGLLRWVASWRRISALISEYQTRNLSRSFNQNVSNHFMLSPRKCIVGSLI